jgi:hypothetical protein
MVGLFLLKMVGLTGVCDFSFAAQHPKRVFYHILLPREKIRNLNLKHVFY